MEVLPNPIDIIENYFNVEVKTKTIHAFDNVEIEQWIDFAKYYLAVMKDGFAKHYLNASQKSSTRLYFEPSLKYEWADAISKRYNETPLLGFKAFLPHTEVSRQEVSSFLNPFKKHMLMTDSIFIQDNFYWGFDAVADSVEKDTWYTNPNIISLVKTSILRLKAFLPILAELRDFILSEILIFMPYYIAPTFPYSNIPSHLQHHLNQLRISSSADDLIKEGLRSSEFDKIVLPWLNARLLNLDPVYPTERMARIGGAFRFDGDIIPPSASDLLSISILPFGGSAEIDLDKLWKLRKNEEVFVHIRKITSACKEYLENNLGEGATPKAANILTKQFLMDNMASLGSQKVISFVEKPAVSLVWRTSLAIATLGTSEIISVLASTLLDSSVGEYTLNRLSPERKAISYLNSVL
jgi:hypothetical protein